MALLLRTLTVLTILTVVANVASPATASADERRGRVVVTDTSIEILELHFIGDSTRITPESVRFLDAVARTLDGNPSITLVEVRAYGSGAAPARRLPLAELRARMVIHELVRRGISSTRLRPAAIAHKPPRATSEIGLVIVNRATPTPTPAAATFLVP